MAMVSALSCGAEICLTPELPYNLDTMGARMKREIDGGRDHILAIVAEGTKMADYLTRWINESIGMEARLTVLGHVQRGGSPTVRDRLMAYKFAVAAVDALEAGESESVVVFKDGDYGMKSIQEVCDSTYRIDPRLLKLSEPLSE